MQFLVAVRDPDEVNSKTLWARAAPVDPSDTDKVTSASLPKFTVVYPPEICSKICKLVLVFVPHVPAFSQLPEVLSLKVCMLMP